MQSPQTPHEYDVEAALSSAESFQDIETVLRRTSNYCTCASLDMA